MKEKKSFSIKDNPAEILLTILVVAAACGGIIYFSIYPKPSLSLALSGGIVAIICALTGVWITVVVTRILLNKQSQSQAELQNAQSKLQQDFQKELHVMQADRQNEQLKLQQEFSKKNLEHQTESEKERDKDIRIFQKKIQVYSKFVGEMWAMISDDEKKEDTKNEQSKITYDKLSKLRTLCFKELVFYLKADQVNKIAEKIKVVNTKESEQAVQEAMSEITAILQKSVYSNEQHEGEVEGGDLKKLFGSFKIDNQDDDEKQNTTETILVVDKGIQESSSESIQLREPTFWHFIMLREKQLEVFERADNWFLSLIEYGDDSKTKNLKRVKPDDVVFLFRTGGYGYIGAFRVTGYMVIHASEKVVEWKRLENNEIKVFETKYDDVRHKDYDIYDAVADGADYVSNILVEPLAFNYKGVGCTAVRRRTIERFVNDPVAVNFIIDGFKGINLQENRKIVGNKIDESNDVEITSKNQEFLNGLSKTKYFSKYLQLLSLKKEVDKLVKNQYAGKLEVWYHQGRCLVYDYVIDDNDKNKIVIDTIIEENGQFRIYLSDRNNDYLKTMNSFSEVITKYHMKTKEIDGCLRYATESYNSEEIADVLAGFRTMVEENINKKYSEKR